MLLVMAESPDDICPRPVPPSAAPTQPLAPPLHLSSVYQCTDPEQAEALLSGELAGSIYRRDGHPNAEMLAEQCRQLHGAECAAITNSGMSALALAVLSLAQQGDHLLVSPLLYGKSLRLLREEFAGSASRPPRSTPAI